MMDAAKSSETLLLYTASQEDVNLNYTDVVLPINLLILRSFKDAFFTWKLQTDRTIVLDVGVWKEFVVVWGKPRKSSVRDNMLLMRDSNSGPKECDTRVLTTSQLIKQLINHW
jgi:hypothetical protein